LCSAKIEGVGSALEKLVCEMNYKSEYSLEIKMKDAPVSELWNVSAFDNLTGLIELTMYGCPPLPMYRLQMLSSLKNLQLYGGSSILFLSVEGESHAKYQFPAERIIISQWDANAKKLTQLLTYFPKLSELNMSLCEKITGIAVVEEQATETLAPTSSDNKVDDNAESEQHQQQEGTRREEEAEGLLLLPSQLQKLWIDHCPELSLCSSPVDPNREAGRTSAGQGLQGLHSLRVPLLLFILLFFVSPLPNIPGTPLSFRHGGHSNAVASLIPYLSHRFIHKGMWGFKRRGTMASPRPWSSHQTKHQQNPQFLRWFPALSAAGTRVPILFLQTAEALDR
jgi:hypothetical protein